MHTGDLAVMDEDGYLRIVGRITDMVIRGGENISPREIEEFLYGLPEISEVEVIGVPSERYGEELMAWVKLRDGATATADDLIAACRDRIAGHKIPRLLEIHRVPPANRHGQDAEVPSARDGASRAGERMTEELVDIRCRFADPRDEASVEQLASLTGTHAPAGPFVMAELDGEPVAAVSIADGRAVAHPYLYPHTGILLTLHLRRLEARLIGSIWAS
jgi:AMP-binding enzyme C-terminal domain